MSLSTVDQKLSEGADGHGKGHFKVLSKRDIGFILEVVFDILTTFLIRNQGKNKYHLYTYFYSFLMRSMEMSSP